MTEPSIPLGPFRLARRIGSGGMAEVWSGVHAAQGVPVAVKVMTGERYREAQHRAAFRNEVQSVASLDHPGVVLVYDHGEVGPEAEEASLGLLPAGSPFLAMELADGGTLDELFLDGLDWSALRGVLLALLDALAHAHARGVVHRDLKPTNVLAFRSGPGGGGQPRLKIADFGLAHAFELPDRPESPQVVAGTPSYMAPEQLRGEWRDLGPWTDLYGLGCLAWCLATSRPPFEGLLLELVLRQLQEPPPELAPVHPMPAGFEAWLRRLLEKDPVRRFTRAADAAWALLALDPPTVASSPLHIQPSPSPDPGRTLPTLSILFPELPERPEPRPAAAPIVPPPLPATWDGAAERGAAERPQAGRHLIGAGLGLWGLRTVPFVGRRSERSFLWQALADVHARRRPHAVVLAGTAGTGKTRLAEWIAERAHEVGGATVLRAAHGSEPGPADGLPRMLARHLRCVGLPRGEVLARAEHLLWAAGVREDSEWIGLADLMAPGAAEEDAGVPAARPQSARERFELLERHIRRLTAERPVLVLLDDVQWGAEAIAFARHLLEPREEPLPVLLLLTARGEALAEQPAEAAALAGLLGMDGVRAIEIPPLPPDERTALIGELLGLAGEVAERVDRRTGGNPLFAVQLVGDWVQRGLLEAGGTGFVLRPGAEVWLPDDLHQVWSDRVERLLDGLPAGSREALEIAAALGTAIDRREHEGACRAAGLGVPPELIESLVANRLAVRTEDEGWTFVHAMLRESLERLASEAGRGPAHHRACAVFLAGREAAGERGVAERLGRHLLQAGEREAALGPLLHGARERREQSDYRGAQALLDQRDEILGTLGAAADDARRGEGWVLRARIHLDQGKLGDVFRWAERAEAAAAGMAWTTTRAEAVRLLGDAARRHGDLDRAAELYERCADLGGATNGAAASLWGLGDLARQRGDLVLARALFTRSRDLYDHLGDPHGIADHLIGLADVARHTGDLAAAEDLYRTAEARFEELGNRYGVSRGVNGRGETARLSQDLARADQLYRRAQSILAALRSADEVFPRFNQAQVALAQGDAPRAAGILEECLARLEEMGWGGLLACVHLARLPGLAESRTWSTWDDAFSRGATAVRSAGLVDPDVALIAELAARAAAAAGQEARARAASELAREQWRRLGPGKQRT